MITPIRSLCLALAVLVAPSAVAQAPRSLETDLRNAIAASKADIAVAMRTLDGRDEVLIDPDGVFHAASTMKVPVMIELFKQARAGTLTLDDPLPIRNQFHSIVDGSPFTLSEGDDSDKAIYAAAGRTMPLRELCEAMITVSSNFAANLLIERLGAPAIQKTVDGLGRRRHARVTRGRGSKGLRQGIEQLHDGARPAHAVRSPGPWHSGGSGVRRRHGRDPEATTLQRRHSGRTARRDPGRAQDRHHHRHPPRCRDRVRHPAIRARSCSLGDFPTRKPAIWS